jgi:8-oxo-dGTP pyrophosphatase MutT (NUDIX family)
VSPTVLTAAELARAITAATHRPDETETLWAAVATVLREHPERGLEVLLIQRAEREGDPWSGHIAYPGGRYSSTDASMQHTAERETIEEVGLDLRAHARLLGRLSNVPARRNGQRVACYVYALTHDVQHLPVHARGTTLRSALLSAGRPRFVGDDLLDARAAAGARQDRLGLRGGSSFCPRKRRTRQARIASPYALQRAMGIRGVRAYIDRR